MRPLSVGWVSAVPIWVQGGLVCVRARSPNTGDADVGVKRTCVRESERLRMRWRDLLCCGGET